MIGNEEIIIKVDGEVKKVLAKNLPSDKIFAVWTTMGWKPVMLDKIKKKPTRTIYLNNGLNFTVTDEKEYQIGDTILTNGYDNGGDTGIALLGLAIGLFLKNGKFEGNYTYYTIPDAEKRDMVEQLWKLCGGNVESDGDILRIEGKSTQNIIENYLNLTNNSARLTDKVYDTTGVFKLGLLEGIDGAGKDGKSGVIRRTNTKLDDDLITLIACMGLRVKCDDVNIYCEYTDEDIKIESISEFTSKKNIYNVVSEDGIEHYMLGNGIMVQI